jgi:hypothetical protein
MKVVRRIRPAALALAAAVLLAACDSPVGGGHIVPNGLVVRAGTTVLAQVVGTTATGQITVAAGAETPVLTVRFLDHSGNEMAAPDGYWLRVVPANATVATWVPDAQGSFTGRIAGLSAGTTRLEFQWMHGSFASAHADFARSVDVVVTPLS